MKEFFTRSYRWQSVYYHFQKWSKDGSLERMWQQVLKKHKSILDLSSAQLDGTHTPSKRGGEAVDYQGRKKCKTSNMLIITDSRGIPVVKKLLEMLLLIQEMEPVKITYLMNYYTNAGL